MGLWAQDPARRPDLIPDDVKQLVLLWDVAGAVSSAPPSSTGRITAT
jgi:hypothetical protein